VKLTKVTLHSADTDVSELGQAPLARPHRVSEVVAVLQERIEGGKCPSNDRPVTTHVAQILPALVRVLAEALGFSLGGPKLAAIRGYVDRKVVINDSCLQDKRLRKGVVGQAQERQTVQRFAQSCKVIVVG
jgi:hypothetical protein